MPESLLSRPRSRQLWCIDILYPPGHPVTALVLRDVIKKDTVLASLHCRPTDLLAFSICHVFKFDFAVHVSDGLSVHHQEFKTVQTPVSDICLLLYVQSWTPDDGRKDRPRHAECSSSSSSSSSFSSASSVDSTILGGSWSVQQFYSTPVYPRTSTSNQQFSSSLGLLLPGPSTLTWVSLLILFYMASILLFFW